MWCRALGIDALASGLRIPTELRISFLGTTGKRCAIVGREGGRSPAPSVVDDVAISAATLQPLGAERVYEDVLVGAIAPQEVGSGYAATQRTSEDIGIQ